LFHVCNGSISLFEREGIGSNPIGTTEIELWYNLLSHPLKVLDGGSILQDLLKVEVLYFNNSFLIYKNK
jgi:hypothetical protein